VAKKTSFKAQEKKARRLAELKKRVEKARAKDMQKPTDPAPGSGTQPLPEVVPRADETAEIAFMPEDCAYLSNLFKMDVTLEMLPELQEVYDLVVNGEELMPKFGTPKQKFRRIELILRYKNVVVALSEIREFDTKNRISKTIHEAAKDLSDGRYDELTANQMVKAIGELSKTLEKQTHDSNTFNYIVKVEDKSDRENMINKLIDVFQSNPALRQKAIGGDVVDAEAEEVDT